MAAARAASGWRSIAAAAAAGGASRWARPQKFHSGWRASRRARFSPGAQLGQDPQGDKASRRARAARSFAAVADAYLAAREGVLRPATLRLARLYLRGDYFRSLHGTSVTELTHADIAAALSVAARRHSVITAAAARRTVSSMCAWAIEEGWLPANSNPALGLRRPPRPEAARARAGAGRAGRDLARLRRR